MFIPYPANVENMVST